MKSVRRLDTRDLIRQSRRMMKELKGFPVSAQLMSFFHPLYLAGLLILVFLGLSLYDRFFTALAATLIFSLIFIYMRTQGLAQSISIDRIVPFSVKFGEEFRVNYEITNRNWSSLPHLVFTDSFSGQRDRTQFYSIESGVAPNQTIKFKVKRRADFEMGTHHYSALTAYVQDVFGFFAFSVEFAERNETKVYPEIEDLKPLTLQGVEEISRFGNLDVEVFGQSPTFSGVRDYRRGDPLKWVSWKLSAKRGELVVREFERLSNADVSICIEMDHRLHVQNYKESSWEITKRLALGIAKQVLSTGAQVQIISQDKFIGYGGGAGYLDYLSKTIMDLRPIENQQSMFEKYQTMIKPRETIIYVSPIFLSSMEDKLNDLSLLMARSVNVIGFFMDSYLLADSKVLKLNQRQMKELRQLSLDQLESVYSWFRDKQLHAYYFKDSSFQDLNEKVTEALKL